MVGRCRVVGFKCVNFQDLCETVKLFVHGSSSSTGKLLMEIMERYRGYLDIPKEDLQFLPDEEPLGTGTTSTVVKAFWKSKPVAVKILTSFIEREARVLDSIRHENIVRFYAAVIGSPNCFLVMELCAGGTLCQYVTDESKPLDIDLAKQWATAIAKGMHYLHYGAPDKPILHRNLMSKNILLDKKDKQLVPKICGFGYAKPNCPNDGNTRSKHNPTVWKGPEVLNEGKPVMKSDVYSFCMVLWHLLSRKLPFQEEEKELSLIPDIVKNEKRPQLFNEWPHSLKCLMEKGWKTDPEERPDFNEVLSVMEGRSAVQSDQHPKHGSPEEQSWDISLSDIQFGSQDENGYLGTNNVYSCVMKAVYKAKDVAAKTLNLHVGITEMSLTKYLDDVHCSKIHHKNIVQIMGAYIAESTWRIVMELMPTSLRKYLKENGALENAPLKIVAQGMADGLQYLHSDQQALGFAHGGLSSSNVLLDVNSPDEREWSVKLSDYCLTTLRPDGSVSHAKAYAAPELVHGQMRPTQADIYSFGVILVEMNTDQVLPTQSSCSDWDETFEEVERNWKALSHLVKKCICDANKRLPSIRRVCEELEDLK